MRRLLQAQGASRGVAIGRVRVRQPHALAVVEQRIDADEVPDEIQRLHHALDIARTELHTLRERLHGALVQEVGEFLDLHVMILDDPDLRHGLDDLVCTGHYSADYALKLQRDRLASVFEGMDDDYFRSRLEDLDHVIGRVHAALHKRDDDHAHGLAGEILVCHSVAPSELPDLLAHGVIAVVSATGSPLSHSAILARSLNLPLVVGAGELLAAADDGDALIVDGGSGELVLDPDDDDLLQYRRIDDSHRRDRLRLQSLAQQPTRSRDGVDVRLFANAESARDVDSARALGADGIGLYRTEFLFMQRRDIPSEDEQFETYRTLVRSLDGKPVTLRTLDLGADKADRAGIVMGEEENPALGVRGIRLSLARAPLFLTQLRAMLRASVAGPVRVLIPMVTGREELLAVRTLLAQAHQQLADEGHAVGSDIQLGAMIEVPAAALGLSGFADLIDFASVGTNDLVQYLLATDRNHEGLAGLYTPYHPGLLHLLKHVFTLAARRQLPIAVCGEMAADPCNTPLLLALGLRDFSLHPGTLLEVRAAVRASDTTHLRRRVPALLRARDRSQIEQWLLNQR